MKRFALTTAIALGLAAPAFANDQISGLLGLEPGSYSAIELAAIKGAVEDREFDNSFAEDLIARYSAGEVSTQSVGVSAGHAQLAAFFGVDPDAYSVADLARLSAIFESDDSDVAVAGERDLVGGGIVSTQSVGISAGHAQLAASLGLDPAEYSLSDLAVIKGKIETTEQQD